MNVLASVPGIKKLQTSGHMYRDLLIRLLIVRGTLSWSPSVSV